MCCFTELKAFKVLSRGKKRLGTTNKIKEKGKKFRRIGNQDCGSNTIKRRLQKFDTSNAASLSKYFFYLNKILQQKRSTTW